MGKFVLAAASALALFVSASPAAAAIVVNFSFNGTVGTTGLVQGQLEFASAGTGVAATKAIVLSAPGMTFSPSRYGENLLPGGFVATNAFTVSDAGVVTAADLQVVNAAYTDMLQLAGSLNGGGSASMVSRQDGTGAFALNFDGYAALTFTPAANVPAAVPEPATWAMMLIGFGTIGGAMRRRKTSAHIQFA